MFTDEASSAYDDGFWVTMWDLHRTGMLDEQAVADTPPPSDSDFNTWLIAGAIGGIALASRIRRWVGDLKLRLGTGLSSAIGSGLSLDGTSEIADVLTDQTVKRLEALGEGEVLRAFTAGQDMALTRTGLFASVGQVWLSRRDGRVCPICASLDGKITVLRPVATSWRVVRFGNYWEVMATSRSEQTHMRLIRLPQVLDLSGLTKSTLDRLEGSGQFPKRFHLSARTIAWREEDILNWVRQRSAPASGPSSTTPNCGGDR
jgi:prophage regulatory protein